MDSFITVVVNGEEREFKMSFGRLNLLARMVQDAEGAFGFLIDNEMREAVTTVLLSRFGPKGKVEEEITPFDVEMTVEDAEKLLEWAQEHLVDFFMKGAEKMARLAEQRMPVLQKLQSSLPISTGSKA